NFAHGAFFVLGSYLCFTVFAVTGNFWLGLLLAPLVVAALAWVVERMLIRRIYHLPHTYHILVSLGLAVIIQEVIIMIWGPIGKSVPTPEMLQGVVLMGDFAYPKYRLFVIGFSALIGLVLWLFLERT